MTEETKVKGSALRRGITAVIVLALVFALLIVGYFAILRPYLQKNQAAETAPVEMIWAHEVASIDNRMLIYEHITRDAIAKIDIHNPENAKFGSQYVDWGVYRYTGETDEEKGMTNGEFYLKGYEYAPYDETKFASLVTVAGYTLATSRIEDHCTDYSKYGLDYATPEEAISVTITATDGRCYTYYVGDKLPSGGGYYVRCINNDKLLATGEEMQRDSVYVLSTTNLELSALSTPQNMVDPYLAFPINTGTSQSLFDEFAIWRREDKYRTPKLDEDGNQVYDENGEPSYTWTPMIHLRPVKDEKDPFGLFSGQSIYYAVVPNGYFGSTTFENLISQFAEFKGDEVIELAEVTVDENGKESIGFDDEVFAKYGLNDYYYVLNYKYSGIDNYIYFSAKQADGYYYAYSLQFNVIARVSEETVFFLNWTPEEYIQNQIVYLQIDNCETVTLEGSYFDLGITNPDRKGKVEVNEIFHMTNTGKDLYVTDDAGNVIDTDNYRRFFTIMYRGTIREEVDEQAIEEAMKKDPMATLTVKTRRKIVYQTDDAGNATTKVDYVLESVSRIYRYYELTNGRVLCTIESIDAEGNSSGEEGSFYMLTSRIEALLSAAMDLKEGITIDPAQRN